MLPADKALKTIEIYIHTDTWWSRKIVKGGEWYWTLWSSINLFIPNWECKIYAVRVCEDARGNLSVPCFRWAGTGSNLFVRFAVLSPIVFTLNSDYFTDVRQYWSPVILQLNYIYICVYICLCVYVCMYARAYILYWTLYCTYLCSTH